MFWGMWVAEWATRRGREVLWRKCRAMEKVLWRNCRNKPPISSFLGETRNILH